MPTAAAVAKPTAANRLIETARDLAIPVLLAAGVRGDDKRTISTFAGNAG
jgi:hypothetical protein